jgi:sugar phosphate isomerase/epimerase
MQTLVSRRKFIAKTTLAASATVLCAGRPSAVLSAEYSPPPIVVFSKVYQTLHLDFEAAAALTAEAGLNGVDCPLRPGGEILPERATEDLPRYVEVLRRKNLQLPLLTTAIVNVSSPHTEEILRLAKKLGIQFYRLGFIDQKKDVPVKKQLSEFKAQLKDLAALNQQIGITALVQNHSPSGHTYIAGDLSQLEEIVSDFDPAQIGAAFDIGHALIVHGDDWRAHFEKLKPHLKIAYVKDAKRDGRWVPFGQGDIGGTGYFKLLKAMGYHAPISLHVEFDWSNKGKNETRAALLTALTESTQVLKRWLAEA